mmetsp:Transcript_13364/g.20167  ORF Transcript_13364/g.20167 Transcript_13364/m.20167 type:complete len:191 (-) Transcript_13364:959-1531(-)
MSKDSIDLSSSSSSTTITPTTHNDMVSSESTNNDSDSNHLNDPSTQKRRSNPHVLVSDGKPIKKKKKSSNSMSLFLKSINPSERFSFEPIGFFHSCFRQKMACPRQSQLVPSAKGVVKLTLSSSFQSRCQYLDGLSSFSHVWLIFIFDQNFHIQQQRSSSLTSSSSFIPCSCNGKDSVTSCVIAIETSAI